MPAVIEVVTNREATNGRTITAVSYTHLVVVAPEDVQTFLGYAAEENLEAVEVAVVTEDPRLVLEWRGKEIVRCV